MIYLFDKDEKLIKIVRKSAVKTALQKYALTTERYVSDRLTVELKGLNADELEQVEYMAIQTMEDAHTFHYFYVAQKFSDELTPLIGVQSGIEELRKSPVYDKRPQNALARDVIADLLAGTNWQARFVGETTPHSTNFYYTSVFDALKKVCEVWDLEMQFFVEMNGNRIGARYIDFKRRIGEAVGKRVVYGHNALQILQEVERTNIFTALIGRGKGEETGDGYGRKITFENVVWSTTQGKPVNKPKGQKHLELPLMTRQYGIKNADGSMRPKIGFVDFSEEANPEILIERTYKALIDAARPQLTLKTSSVYLKGVKVGDTIRVVRHDKKLDYDTRIFEITFNRLNNQSSDIKLGDRIGESNEAKAQKIADKAVEQFVNNEFSNFVQNLPDYLPSADGFNNNWYGAEDPTVQYPGKVLINDIWYKPDPEHEGHKIMLRWSGEVWEEILRTYDSEALRDRIAEEIAQVNQSMQAQSEEHDRQVADILSKTQSVETLANQAKTDAASAITQALLSKDEAIADATAQVATVSQALSTAKTDLQNQVNAVDAKAVQAQSDATSLRTDLDLQAGKILEQAQAQTALTSRVTTVETLADGTKTTVTELSKTVSKATGDITSVTNRTKVVEDGLAGVKTNYTQLSQTVNTQTGQIQTINSKAADLQSGLDGVNERFENLQVGGENLLLNAGFEGTTNSGESFTVGGVTYTTKRIPNWNTLYNGGISNPTTSYHAIYRESFEGKGPVIEFNESNGSRNWKALNAILRATDLSFGNYTFSADIYATGTGTKIWFGFYYYNKSGVRNFHSGQTTINISTINKWHRVAGQIKLNDDIDLSKEVNFYIYACGFTTNSILYLTKPKLENGTVPTAFSLAQETIRSEIAEYKRTADQNYAGLQSTVSTLDGKVTQNKTEANQTATQLSNRLTSLETYKDGEATRSQSYFEASKTETARQITAERTAIATNYVAKSTYEENVSGTTLKLNEIKTTADTTKQNLATYQDTVDRKLTELTTSTQTLDGKINTASAKVDTVAGQIRTEISQVESKIPTSVGGRNYILKSQAEIVSAGGWVNKTFNLSSDLLSNLPKIKTITISCDLEGMNVTEFNNRKQYGLAWAAEINGITRYLEVWQTEDTPKKRISRTFTVPEGEVITKLYNPSLWIQAVGDIKVSNPKIEFGRVPTDHTLAPEDINDELSSVKTTITQTASGVEQLSTSLSTTNGKVTTAETKISQLISDVSSKVSQTDYNTLTGRVSSAETAITQNATEISKRLTSTQVEQAITDKGYATVTALNNKVKETADSFSRTISETKALIPTFVGGRNLIPNTKSLDGYVYKTSDKYMNFNIARTTKGATGYSDTFSATTIDIADGDTYTASFFARTSVASFIMCYWCSPNTTSRAISSTGQVSSRADGIVFVTTSTEWKRYWVTWNQSTTTAVKHLIVGRNHASSEGTIVEIAGVKLEKGTVATDWSPAPEDIATVTALHNVSDTVDSHTRTIGAVGTTGSILDNVSKVTQTANGLVTEVSGANGLKTQVSTLAGSYAIKSLTKAGDVLGQINLNKDGSVKIDGSLVQITGTTYIKDGVISSAKIGDLDAGKIKTGTLDAARIATNSITGSHIAFDQAFVNKMTANEAYLKQIFAKNAFITSVQSTNISADMIKGGLLKSSNGFTEFDLNNGNIKFTNMYGKIYRKVGAHQVQLTTTSWDLIDSASGSFTAINSGDLLTASRRAGLEFELTESTSSVTIFGNNIDIYPDNAAKNLTLSTNRRIRLTFDGQDIATVNSLTNDSKGKWNKDSILTTSNNFAIVTSDIKLAGHFDSVEKIITELCKKANITWL